MNNFPLSCTFTSIACMLLLCFSRLRPHAVMSRHIYSELTPHYDPYNRKVSLSEQQRRHLICLLLNTSRGSMVVWWLAPSPHGSRIPGLNLAWGFCMLIPLLVSLLLSQRGFEYLNVCPQTYPNIVSSNTKYSNLFFLDIL